MSLSDIISNTPQRTAPPLLKYSPGDIPFYYYSSLTNIPEETFLVSPDDPIDVKSMRSYPKLKTWFDHPDTTVDYQQELYPDIAGCLNRSYLFQVFKEIDLRIEKLVRCRILPSFKKEVTLRNNCVVGCLSVQQWMEYINLKNGAIPSKTQQLKSKIPSFDKYTCVYRKYTRRVCWNYGNLPKLLHKDVWWYMKWKLEDRNISYRAYVMNFALVHNSYLGTISVEFTYATQLFSKSCKQWMTI